MNPRRAAAALLLLALATAAFADWPAASLSGVVKVYGEGGVRGLEGYRSGVLVSDDGVVLTFDGALLDAGEATVVDARGGRYTAALTGTDPLTGIAVLKISLDAEDAASADLRPFALPTTPRTPPAGQRVWVLSNAFDIAAGDEPVSVQGAVVAAVSALGPGSGGPPLLTRTPVLWLDSVTSNPGAAGGAVVDARGALVGMIGPELRSGSRGVWLNYAAPAPLLREAMDRAAAPPREARSAEPRTAPRPATGPLGFWLVPAVGRRAPAYVEGVAPGSPAASAGLVADDLVLLVDGRAVDDVAQAEALVAAAAEAGGAIELSVLRGERLLELVVVAPRGAEEAP